MRSSPVMPFRLSRSSQSLSPSPPWPRPNAAQVVAGGAGGGGDPPGEDEGPPDPPEPVAPVRRRRARARGDGPAWPTWPVPEGVGFPFKGKFVLDASKQSLAFHCCVKGHDLCRLNRSLVGGRNKAQGRPVGAMLAWAAAGENYPDQASRMTLAKRIHMDSPLMAFGVRMELRTLATMQEDLHSLLDLERDQRGDEEYPEPASHCAY